MNLITVQNMKAHAKVIYLTKDQVANAQAQAEKLPGNMEELQRYLIEQQQKYAADTMDTPVLFLSPGNNPVPEPLWVAAKKNIEIKSQLESGEIREVVFQNVKTTVPVSVPTIAGEGTEAMPATISEKEISEALSLIENENHVEVLNAWRIDEAKGKKRKGVIEGIDARIKHLRDNTRNPNKAS